MNLLNTYKNFVSYSPFARRIRRFTSWFSRPRQFDGYNKVFCIGWLKTGTTSFGNAMRRLGFKHCGWDGEVYEWYKKGDIDKLIRYASRFESFDDLPWNRVEILERLDKEFPGSKFVLLERDNNAWFKSAQKHREKYKRPGAGQEDKDAFVKEYEERNDFVRKYFSGEKRDQLLIMNVISGEGYEKLCPFLNLDPLDEKFPHSNKS